MERPISRADLELFTVTHNHCEKNSFFEEEYIMRSIDCFENILKKNIQVNSTSSGFENYVYMV